jgi:RNA polymerase primary sigma factor
VAKQYQNQDALDLIEPWTYKAAQRFDETRGFKFISLHVWWIRQSILQALAEQSRIVRLPLKKLVLSIKSTKCMRLLEQSNERPPSAGNAKELDMTVNDVKESMKTLVVTYQWMHLLLRRRF